TLTPNLTAFTGVDSQNLPDVMVSVQFILAIGVQIKKSPDQKIQGRLNSVLAVVPPTFAQSASWELLNGVLLPRAVFRLPGLSSSHQPLVL
ncbi:hypothetical protein EFR23_01885, partial [Lactobacillus delbrueckii subsp. lactis]|nr:hypothetical protein [Lactobacillus delbrueckii subsp. lactis]